MAYTQRFTHKAFFSIDASTLDDVLDIGAASADAGEMSCAVPCAVAQLQFHVTDEAVVGTTTAPTVIFTKRPTPNSATGEVAIGTLTIPDGTAVGAVIYKDIDPVSFAVGDTLEISHTVGVGSPAGQGIPVVIAYHDPEVPGNMTDMTASA